MCCYFVKCDKCDFARVRGLIYVRSLSHLPSVDKVISSLSCMERKHDAQSLPFQALTRQTWPACWRSLKVSWNVIDLIANPTRIRVSSRKHKSLWWNFWISIVFSILSMIIIIIIIIMYWHSSAEQYTADDNVTDFAVETVRHCLHATTDAVWHCNSPLLSSLISTTYITCQPPVANTTPVANTPTTPSTGRRRSQNSLSSR